MNEMEKRYRLSVWDHDKDDWEMIAQSGSPFGLRDALRETRQHYDDVSILFETVYLFV